MENILAIIEQIIGVLTDITLTLLGIYSIWFVILYKEEIKKLINEEVKGTANQFTNTIKELLILYLMFEVIEAFSFSVLLNIDNVYFYILLLIVSFLTLRLLLIVRNLMYLKF